jgi:hypothetical protein
LTLTNFDRDQIDGTNAELKNATFHRSEADMDDEKNIVEKITEAIAETAAETVKAVMADVNAIAAEMTEAVADATSAAHLSGQALGQASDVALHHGSPVTQPDRRADVVPLAPEKRAK